MVGTPENSNFSLNFGTPINLIIFPRCTDFYGRECSDLGVGQRKSNIVQICKAI